MRYLVDFDTSKMDYDETDVLVIGSGIAGLTAAFECAPYYKTTVLSKSFLSNTATWYAQGGIATAISKEDSLEQHYNDTIKTGAGLCNPKVVRAIISESLTAISFLRNTGAEFDQEKGRIKLALEGGHSKARILHKKDFTGSEVQQKLIKAVLKKKGIQLIENAFSIDLLTDKNSCIGVIVKKRQKKRVIFAKTIILATGGAGQLYEVTTNPSISTGDGIAIAYRAGVELTDMEFIQFHPTTLHSRRNPRFLITEALRGEGAYLEDVNGTRFLRKISEEAELAPRDIVSQAIFKQIQKQAKKYVYIDARHLKEKLIKDGYPNIYKVCLEEGYDITKELVPVSPAAHFIIGGIKTGLYGETSMNNLYASGECAATGFHGANRLASNSLLEGVVMSRRIAMHLQNKNLKMQKKKIAYKRSVSSLMKTAASLKRKLKKTMGHNISMIRNYRSLKEAQGIFKDINDIISKRRLTSKTHFELANLAQLAQIISASAQWRKESRGVNIRDDYPATDIKFVTKKVVKKSG
ncbi:MAG: L-aspartate oxidase [Actinobacteria bacterium]|nr:MAG: L-aspartate oxidase [Actinomycetota bacterium]